MVYVMRITGFYHLIMCHHKMVRPNLMQSEDICVISFQFTINLELRLIQVCFPYEGGFQADVTVKGTGFECSSEGELCPCPREARESAAKRMFAKLGNMQNMSL